MGNIDVQGIRIIIGNILPVISSIRCFPYTATRGSEIKSILILIASGYRATAATGLATGFSLPAGMEKQVTMTIKSAMVVLMYMHFEFLWELVTAGNAVQSASHS